MEEKARLEKVDPSVAGASKRWDGFLESPDREPWWRQPTEKVPNVNSLLTVHRNFPLYRFISNKPTSPFYCFILFNEILLEVQHMKQRETETFCILTTLKPYVNPTGTSPPILSILSGQHWNISNLKRSYKPTKNVHYFWASLGHHSPTPEPFYSPFNKEVFMKQVYLKCSNYILTISSYSFYLQVFIMVF